MFRILPHLSAAARSAAGALAAAALVGACTHLSGDDLTSNPNSPSSATANQQIVAVASLSGAFLTGDNNRIISIWMQQMAGSGRQWLTYDSPYIIDENSFGSFAAYYEGGGLVDIRGIQAKAKAANDQVYLGIAQVWEALEMSFVADVWGDIPYREAINPAITQPKLDPQQQVYADLQTLLDQAITNLGGSGGGPGAFDLIYGGDATKWKSMAYTLKARLYLHTAEKDPSAYAKALAAAQNGIADASGGGDWKTYQSSTVGEENQWFQFNRGRGTDISVAATYVDTLQQRNDPRLAQFVGTNAEGQFLGAMPGQEGSDFSWLSATRADPGFRQPLVTYAENQLILAEAQLQTGDATSALASLNAERQAAGVPAVATGLSTSVVYQQIMSEKWVALFQNPEVWNDYKRTCWPNLSPGSARSIPARFFYGADERGVNTNIPSPNAAPRRNWNDPANTTALDGSTCLGQANGG